MPRISIKKQYNLYQDIKYKNLLLGLLINRVLQKGKKLISQKIVYKTLNFIAEKEKNNPILILEKAITNIQPSFQIYTKFTQKKKGTPFYQKINKYCSVSIAIKWIIFFARTKKDKPFYIRLSNEILDAYLQKGSAITKKEDLYKLAEGLYS